MTFSIIAAIGLNREIGYKNDLLWHIPADLKRFKTITKGHTVIMGRKTFESIDCKPLHHRRNIIITSKPDYSAEGSEIVHSIKEAIELVRNNGEVFILGGAEIYKQFLPLTDTMYLTLIKKEYKADTYFPEYNPKQWKVIEQNEITHDEGAGVGYSFLTLKRIE